MQELHCRQDDQYSFQITHQAQIPLIIDTLFYRLSYHTSCKDYENSKELKLDKVEKWT